MHVIGFENIRIPPSTRYRIRCEFIFFRFGVRIQKYPDSLPNSPDACGRKPYPERKICGFKNIRIRVDGALMADSIKNIATNPEFHIDTLLCFGNKTLMTEFDRILRSQKREKFPNARNHYFSANFQFSSFLFILADICKTQTVEWHNRREENIEFPQQKHSRD